MDTTRISSLASWIRLQTIVLLGALLVTAVPVSALPAAEEMPTVLSLEEDACGIVLTAASGLALAAIARSAGPQQIPEQAVIDAQEAWGEGIVAIARMHADGGDYTARATEHINDLYAYGETSVMFKPTLAAEDQFRETFEEALSYFVGRDGTEDKGFAIAGWTNVRWENNGIYTNDVSAMAMGNYYFTGPDGNETKVEYTFGYVLIDGELKINLHHSSLPYTPE